MFVTFIIIAIISSLVKFDYYRDTRAAILDPCIQGILYYCNIQMLRDLNDNVFQFFFTYVMTSLEKVTLRKEGEIR